MTICYVCERKVIKPFGYSQSKVLIIGDSPGRDELDQLKPFVGNTGKVLRKEMSLVGIDAYSCRMVNLWYHAPWKATHKNFEPCFEASKDVVLEEAKGKQAILLIGASPVEYFTGHKVSDVNGLQVDSNMLSAPVIFAMMQPTRVFKGLGIGELKFALKSFSDCLKKEGII